MAWAHQPAPESRQLARVMQQPTQQPTPQIEEVTQPPPTVTKCAFCGKTTHATEKCSFMLKARKVHREAQAEADAAKAAAAAAKE